MSKLVFVLIALFLYGILVAAIFSVPTLLIGQLVVKTFLAIVLSGVVGGVCFLQVRGY